ncbi:DNA end-binding protein Ku [Actinopolyspora alba]|uniref:Non-homologous end joining protein Ku n=1 Tax=Actinopolyspora alba TaxID=673379 RepID=A0A1I1WY49_9ACTN|nr:Ku protein [Actinopolyspora alba]SFD98393.1 DNA end-binding protein Ku [Actinopolyspora alba]
MPHKIWAGSLKFGLVTIPVGLYSATEDHGIRFNQYERGTHDRVRYRRINERTGKELEGDEVVRGLEVDGTLVTVEQRELDDIAPERSGTIEIAEFVALSEIDPVYFQKAYWVAPADRRNARGYSLLRRAMAETERVGIATFVFRGREYLTALRPESEALVLHTMFFLDEIRDPANVLEHAPPDDSYGSRELRLAGDLIRSMSTAWHPEEHVDTHTARIERLLADKAAGRAPRSGTEHVETTATVDLAEALRRSTERARAERKHSGSGGERADRDAERPETAPVSTLTREELRRRARELDIRGRSKLNRAQLEKAITESPGVHGGGRATEEDTGTRSRGRPRKARR